MDVKACMMFSSKLEKIKTTSKEIYVALAIKQIKGKEKETQEKKPFSSKLNATYKGLTLKTVTGSYMTIHLW